MFVGLFTVSFVGLFYTNVVLVLIAAVALGLVLKDLNSQRAKPMFDIPLAPICASLDPGSWLWYFYGCWIPNFFSALRKSLRVNGNNPIR